MKSSPSIFPLTTALVLSLNAIGGAQITEVIDWDGDGAGNFLCTPLGIETDGAGNVYVTGNDSHNAFVITPAGAVTEIIDATGDGAGNVLRGPNAVAVDHAGTVYVSGANTITLAGNAFAITPSGVVTEIIDVSGDGAGSTLLLSSGIAVDASRNVYVAGAVSHNVFRVTPGGTITEIIDASGDGSGNALDIPGDLAVDAAGNVYVAGVGSNNVFRITPGGAITEIIDGTGDGAGNPLEQPFAVAVDASGNVYVAGSSSDNAFEITPGGTITEIIDGTGDGAGNPLERTVGVAVDGSGNVYVTGRDSDNAFRIAPSGVVTEVIDAAGDGIGNLLNGARGVAVDGSDNVYVTGTIGSNAFRIAAPECFLVLGEGPGRDVHVGQGHAFVTQLDGIFSAHAVTLTSSPTFEIPAGAALPGIGAFSGGGAYLPGPGLRARYGWTFAAQILMWNPGDFPGNPEQHTRGMVVAIDTAGNVRTLLYGSEDGGIEMSVETGVNAQGDRTIRFPFTIEGF